MFNVPVCPVCKSELRYDEVDIGVGIQIGSYGCECCGWCPDADEVDECSLRGEFV